MIFPDDNFDRSREILLEGESISEIFSQEYSLIAILVLIVMILFLGYGAEKMNKILFGEYITKLESQIKEIEKVS